MSQRVINNKGSRTILEIGSFRLGMDYERTSVDWSHPMAGRFDKPKEAFYYDGVSIPISERILNVHVDKNHGAIGKDVIADYKRIKTFDPGQEVEAIEFIRQMINDEGQ